jgi:hypothetical protein
MTNSSKNQKSGFWLHVLIFLLIIISVISCRGPQKPSNREMIGSYVIVTEPFPNANFRRYGRSGIYCPAVFLKNMDVFFCDYGWGEYFFESNNTILMDFKGEILNATIDNKASSYLEISINRDKYVLNDIGFTFLFKNRIQGTYCSYYEIDGEETIEFWRITSDQICLENSHGLRKCDDYDVLNGNAIMLDSDNEVMVFQIAKEHTFDFSGFILYQKNQIDRFLMSCSARGIEDLVE